jgi:hypothetical protein
VSRERVTAVTTVTSFSRVPSPRVAQIVRSVPGTLLRNSARGDVSESGYSGYGQEWMPSRACAHARVRGMPVLPHPSHQSVPLYLDTALRMRLGAECGRREISLV